MALRRRGPRRDLGLERRRLHDAQHTLPLPGNLSHRHLRGAGPDQRLYDTIYQERYQGLPDENPDAYEQGSPITFAEHLQGNLLLIHGTGDDNVHYQGMERLIDQLIALNKPFTMMAYPNRSHAISEGEGTSRHLYELMTRFLKANLPAGPEPSGPALPSSRRPTAPFSCQCGGAQPRLDKEPASMTPSCR